MCIRDRIKALYEKEWESIIGNCDTLLFLGGGNEPTSLEFIVKLLGKETIATRTRGQTKGRSGSSSTNFQPVSYTHLLTTVYTKTTAKLPKTGY